MKDFQERMDSFQNESRRIYDRSRNCCDRDCGYEYECENDPCDRRPDNCCDNDHHSCHDECNNCCKDNCCENTNECRGCHNNCGNGWNNGQCDCNCQHQIDDCETNCGDWIPYSWGCGCEIPLPPLPPEPEDCCCNGNNNSCCNNYYYDSNLLNMYNRQSVAMAYVPRVFFNSKRDIYSLDRAFERGGLFKVLDKPFKGGHCR